MAAGIGIPLRQHQHRRASSRRRGGWRTRRKQPRVDSVVLACGVLKRAWKRQQSFAVGRSGSERVIGRRRRREEGVRVRHHVRDPVAAAVPAARPTDEPFDGIQSSPHSKGRTTRSVRDRREPPFPCMEERLKHHLFMLYSRIGSPSQSLTESRHDLRLQHSKADRSKAGLPVSEELCSTASPDTQFELNPADTVLSASAFFLEKSEHIWRIFP